MPIKGLSDRGLAFPEIGQIRKGAKKTENRPGADLTYFRVEFGETETKTAAKFEEIYGPRPQAIRVLLPFNEIERCWNPWKEAYTAGRLVARSDGEFIQYALDKNGEPWVINGVDKNGVRVPHPTDDIAGYDYQNKPVKYKNNGRLKVILPELTRVAYLTVMTTSTHDIVNISEQLAGFSEINGGQIAGIPFILRRRPKSISMPKSEGDKTRVRRIKWLLSLEVDSAWAQAKFGELAKIALPDYDATNPNILQLAMGDITEVELDEDDLSEGEPMPEDGTPAPEVVQEVLPVKELIDPMGKWAVEYAAKQWNVSTKEAAQQISSKNLGNRIDAADFVILVNGGAETK